MSHGTDVVKIPCANHLVKNLKNHLEESKKDYKDLTKEEVAKISYIARMVNSDTSSEECREGLLNCARHVGGNHLHCRESLNCTHPKVDSAVVWVDATSNQIQVYKLGYCAVITYIQVNMRIGTCSFNLNNASCWQLHFVISFGSHKYNIPWPLLMSRVVSWIVSVWQLLKVLTLLALCLIFGTMSHCTALFCSTQKLSYCIFCC